MVVKVLITTHYFPEFNEAEFLAAVGSCLGLWLGLGVVHIVDIFATTTVQFCARQCGWK